MIANYHAHTWRCGHAEGTEREYARKALEAGFTIFGFSDHAPLPYPPEYVSPIRMTMAQLPDYVATILALRKEFAGKLEIPLGLEVEYSPAYLPGLLRQAEQYPIDYLLLAQHYPGEEPVSPYSGAPVDSPALLNRYCDLLLAGLESGRFTYMAHPDLLCFTGSNTLYDSAMRRVCLRAISCGVPLEINLLGLAHDRHYPNPRFWRLAGELGCRAVLGLDTHSPSSFAEYPALEARVRRLSADWGVILEDTVSFRDPFHP